MITSLRLTPRGTVIGGLSRPQEGWGFDVAAPCGCGCAYVNPTAIFYCPPCGCSTLWLCKPCCSILLPTHLSMPGCPVMHMGAGCWQCYCHCYCYCFTLLAPLPPLSHTPLPSPSNLVMQGRGGHALNLVGPLLTAGDAWLQPATAICTHRFHHCWSGFGRPAATASAPGGLRFINRWVPAGSNHIQ